MRPAKIQISLRIRAVWSESSLGEFWIAKYTITRTSLYNFDPLKPHFYIVKLGFTGVDIIFLISAHNIDCGYSLERVPTIYVFEQKYENYQNFYLNFFHFLVVKFSVYLNRHVFVIKVSSCGQRRLIRLRWGAADLSLCWAHMSESTFLLVAARISH